MIVTIQTNTFGAYGGIATYNRLVCRVLDQFTDSEPSPVFIVTDRASDLAEAAKRFPGLRLRAFDHNRWALLLHFVRALAGNVDLILLGHVNYAPLGWLARKLRPHVRYGVMLYGIEAWTELPKLKRNALQRADFLISISDYTTQAAIKANQLTADRVYLLPNALELPAVDAVDREDLPEKNGGTRILTVCRLDHSEQYKGVDKVIEAMPTVLERIPDLHFDVVGGGTDLDRHRALAVKLGVAERVHFLGFLDHQALQARYLNCDVFAMPSAGEGFGFVFLEAMRYSKPVVAANSGGVPEVVQDGITGHLVEYGNTLELAETLIALCLDPDKRARLGDAGYQRLQKEFTYTQFEQSLIQILLNELPPGATCKLQRQAIPLEGRYENQPNL